MDYPPNDGQSEASSLEIESEALRDEIAALNDRVLRLAAELENTRRRAEREKQDAGRYAIATFARDLLAVADTFEMAMTSVPGATAGAESVAAFVEGVRMTDKELRAAFERHGVRRIEPEGQKFDPNFHMAVAQAAGEAPAGHVLAVAAPGYVIGDRVLRAALVVVSTGAPQAVEPSPYTEVQAPAPTVDAKA